MCVSGGQTAAVNISQASSPNTKRRGGSIGMPGRGLRTATCGHPRCLKGGDERKLGGWSAPRPTGAVSESPCYVGRLSADRASRPPKRRRSRPARPTSLTYGRPEAVIGAVVPAARDGPVAYFVAGGPSSLPVYSTSKGGRGCLFIELDKQRHKQVRHTLRRLIPLLKFFSDSLQNGAVTEPQRQDASQLGFEVLLRAIQFV